MEGCNIRRAREAKGLTQVQVAAALGVTQTAVSGMERAAARDAIKIGTLRKIAPVLGLTLAALVDPEHAANGRGAAE